MVLTDGLNLKNFQKVFRKRTLGIRSQQYHQMEIQLFFQVVERGYGKTDLYEITFENNQWSVPKNLGTNINSAEEEKSPFLHTDGKTLFFSSTNFPTLVDLIYFIHEKIH